MVLGEVFWALGIILYIMINCAYPFKGNTNQELFKEIKKGKYSHKKHVSQDFSP